MFLCSRVPKGTINQLVNEQMLKKLESIHSDSAHHSPQALSPQQQDVSGDGFSQKEVSVLFPAQHSVHFEGVG